MSITHNDYEILHPFQAWVQQSLPAVYDDSLSYTDLLYKMLSYINKLVTNNNYFSEDIKKMYDYVNNYFNNLDVQDEINNKLDEMVTNGQLTTIVDKFLSSLSDYTYHLNYMDSFDENNIDLVFAELMSKIKKGESAILTAGTYYATDTIDLSKLPNNCTIVIDGSIKMTANKDCIKLGGTFEKITINELIGYSATETHLAINNGIKIEDLFTYSELNVRHIRFFEKGILFKCRDNSNYSQYNKITFDYIENTPYGIYFDGTEHTGWVNENTFTGGRIRGGYGIYMIGGTGESGIGFNSNKFYNIGLEELYEDGIYINGQAYANVFENFRAIENISKLVINENIVGVSFAHNMFKTDSQQSLSKIHLSGLLSTVLAPVTVTVGGPVVGYGYYKLEKDKDSIGSTIPNDVIFTKEISISKDCGQGISYITGGFNGLSGYDVVSILPVNVTGNSDNFTYCFIDFNASEGTYNYKVYNPSSSNINVTIKSIVLLRKI